MDFLRKFGFWVLAGVLVLGAGLSYWFVVRKIGANYQQNYQASAGRRDALKGLAADKANLPSPGRIKAEEKAKDAKIKQVGICDVYLSSQPRRCNTRLFFENELSEITGVGREIEGDYPWQERYNAANNQLQVKLEQAGFGEWRIRRSSGEWEPQLPTRSQKQHAQELHWFQLDLANTLIDNAAAELDQYITAAAAENASPFPRSTADLVINREPSRISEPLRLVERQKLLDVLTAILVNREDEDMATVFDKHVGKTFPWSDVRKYTIDDQQRAFLEHLTPKDDLSNLQRFAIYVEELRSVRYRGDLAWLLKKYGNAELAELVRNPSREDLERLRYVVGEWNATRLAQTIADVINIRDAEDYALIKRNHAPQVQWISDIGIARPHEINPTPASEQPGAEPDVALEWRAVRLSKFDFTIRIELEHFPVFCRRLLNTPWRYTLAVKSIMPVGPMTISDGASGAVTLNMVTVGLHCESYQFPPPAPVAAEATPN